MAASPNDPMLSRKRLRRRWWLFLAMVPASFGLVCWWLTEPLEDLPSGLASDEPIQAPSAPDLKPIASPGVLWPSMRLEGAQAKKVVLDALLVATNRLSRLPSYTATLRKQERIKGKLGPVQTLSMKVRNHPFALYFKFLSPQAGKEVVYAEGHHDNKLIAHSGGVARLLVPRLAVAPDHPLALADSRHPVTEAGLVNLVERLLKFRRLDLTDNDAETVLDRVTDSSGYEWLRSIHLHSIPNVSRPFARIEVLYEPDTFFPMQIRNFDWPEQGHASELLLAEEYIYENVDFACQLSALDFDPANPNYAFHRF